jgi:hypothetical protein
MSTMSLLIVLAAFALLFAAFAMVRHRPSCSSDCGSCATPCSYEDWKDETH